MTPQPGEIWLADLGLAAETRPVLIVSRHDPDAPCALLTYVPLTTQHRGSRYEIPLRDLPFLHQPSVANVQGIGSLIKPRLERELGSFPLTQWRRSKTPFASPSNCNVVISAQMRRAWALMAVDLLTARVGRIMTDHG